MAFYPKSLNSGLAGAATPYQTPTLPTPQKSIQPVNQATGVAAPAPVNPMQAGKTWDQFYQPYFNTGSYADRPGDIGLELREGNAAEMAKLMGFSGQTTTPTTYMQGGMNEGGDTNVRNSGNAYTPEFQKALEGYRFAQSDPYRTAMLDSSGRNLGTFKSGDEESAFDKFAWKAVPLAIGAMGAGALGYGLGGAGQAVGNGAFLGEGVASGIPAWDAAAGLGGLGEASTGALGLEGASYALPGAESGFSLANVAAPAAEATAYGVAPEMTALEGLMGAGYAPESLAMGGEMAGNASGIGAAGAGAASAAPGIFNAAQDSQLYNQAAGISGADAAAAATVPSTVNLPGNGGTMATSGGITGAIAQALADPLNAAKTAGSSLLSGIKENPMAASLALGAAAPLLGGNPDMPSAPGSGGGAGGAGANPELIQALTDKLYGTGGSLSGMPDFSTVPGLKTSAGDRNTFNQEAIDAAYGQQTRYLDPQIAQQQKALESRLAEQGFVPGTPAYNQAMQNFMDTNQRAYAQARDSSILQGAQIGQGDFRNAISNTELNNAASNATLQQLINKRNQPLNELNALKSGEQVNYNNQLDQYNAQVASKNSQNQALSQLALALGMYLG